MSGPPVSAQGIVDHLQHLATTARDACAASTLKRAHNKIMTSIRQHAALKLTSACKTRLLKRAQDICDARLQLLADLKALHHDAVEANGGATTSKVASSSSFDSLFVDDGKRVQKPTAPEQEEGGTSVSHGPLFLSIHRSVSAALMKADVLCSMTMPALGLGVKEEIVLLYQPVLGSSLPSSGRRSIKDGEDSSSSGVDDDESSPMNYNNRATRGQGGDKIRRRVVGKSDPSSSPLASFSFPPLQTLTEEAYLRSVILASLSVDALVQLLDGALSGGGGSESDGGPSHERDGHEEPSVVTSAAPPDPLSTFLERAAERLALRAALDDVRCNESKICKRFVPSDVTTVPAGNNSDQQTLVCPPAVLVGSPDALPYCVAIVYGAAVQRSIRDNGLHATLQDILNVVVTDTQREAAIPPLDHGVLQFLIQCVLEPAARNVRLTLTHHHHVHVHALDNEESDTGPITFGGDDVGVEACMRRLRCELRQAL
jgi:hypothetical protein